MSRKQGVVTAFVNKVDAEQGRVEVRFDPIEDDLKSSWAYIAAPMSGKSRGALFMPEKDDEVLVAFGNDRFDTPYVLGFLWNGQQISPEKTPKNRVIVTPGNHQLRFEDKDKTEGRVILKSNGGHTITLEDKDPKKIEIKSTKHTVLLDDSTGAEQIEIKSTQHTVLLDDTAGSANISIKAGQAGMVSINMKTTPPSITLSTGAGSLTIDSTGVSITAPGTVTINAPGSATVNCATATINAAGAMTLNASLLSVNSGIATFAGVVQCSALITNAVVSSAYTPGLGNML